MKVCVGLLLSVLGSLVLVGCSSGGRSGGGREDAGGIMLMGDSGGMTMRDSGGMTMRDSGGMMTMCAEHPVPPPGMPGCDAATRTCFGGCMDDACINMCLMADSTPMDCNGCLNQAIISCANDMGCQGDWDQFECCAEDNCGAMPSASCVMSMCGTQDDAYGACIGTLMPGACSSAIGVCFRG